MTLKQALKDCLSAKSEVEANAAWAIVEEEAYGMSPTAVRRIYIQVKTEFLS